MRKKSYQYGTDGRASPGASLCNEENTTIIGTSLFLPQKWINDKVRCDKAGIPTSKQLFQTKPQMALSLIKSNIKLGVKFDWIGGDGLYGNIINHWYLWLHCICLMLK